MAHKAGMYNVTDYGATGDGTTDDTAAIQAAINASVAGSTVWFPAGTYAVTSPVRLLSYRHYLGSGSLMSSYAKIQQKAGTNMVADGGPMTGILVSDGWYTNKDWVDYPLSIAGLTVDGNFTSNPGSTACGILLKNYDSTVEHCLVWDTPYHGICLTDTGQDGVTRMTNTSPENRIQFNRIYTSQGHGFSVASTGPPGGPANTDGFLVDNLISGSKLDAVNFHAAFGWLIRGNHTYSNLGSGIKIYGCEATRITENYIEVFGDANAPGGWYEGIYCNVQGHRGTIITGNHVSCNEPSPNVSYYQYIAANAGYGAKNARVVIAGNVLSCNGTPGPNGTGIWMGNNGAGALMTAALSGNIIADITRETMVGAGVTVQ